MHFMSARKHCKPWLPRQPYLLPPSPSDWLPKNHLVYFILDVSEHIDLSAIEERMAAKDLRGERPFVPQMMMTLLLYAYCVGIFSSRKIARATYENVAFRVITGGHHPHFTTINNFRKDNLDVLGTVFKDVLLLCRKAGIAKLGHIAVDGSKIQGNASKHKAMSYEYMQQLEKHLETEIAGVVARAEEADATDDERLGQDVDEVDIPAELQRREDRLAKIREAKQALEQEARLARAQHERELARGCRERAEKATNERDRKRNETLAQQHEQRALDLAASDDDEEPPSDLATDDVEPSLDLTTNDEEHAADGEEPSSDLTDDDNLTTDDEDDEPGANDPEPPSDFTTVDGLAKHRPRTKPDGAPHPKAQRCFTDADSRLQESGGVFLQGYNCQAAVDAEHQIIVAAAVTNRPPDAGNLEPMLRLVIENCGRAPDAVSADSGYWTEGVGEACSNMGTEAYVATERRKHWAKDSTIAEGPPPQDATARERMRHKLRTKEGRKIYAWRKVIVEPVFGQIKEPRGFRRFSLRGLGKVTAEWSLVCATHNLLKLFRANLTLAAAA